MKKIFICILLCFYVTGVEALEYTDYSPFSDYSDKVIKSDDLTDVKMERRYKFYKLHKVTGPYVKEGGTLDDYPYIDKEEFVYGEYSDYSFERPLEVPLREIDDQMINHYKMAGPIDYVTVTATRGDVYLDNFIFLYKNEKVDYDTISLENSFPLIKKGSSVSFKLAKKVQLANLEIRVKGLGNISDNYDFEITLGSNDKVYQKITSSTPGNSGAVIYCNGFRPIDYDDYYSFEELESNKFVNFVDKVKVYRYRDIMYQSYKVEKEYYPGYLVSGFGDYIYKDDLDYKDYYAKRTRSIIEDIKRVGNFEGENKVFAQPQVSNLVSILEENSKENLNSYDSSYKVFESPLKSEKIAEEKVPFWYFIGPLLILFGIIILVLSKLYKRKK